MGKSEDNEKEDLLRKLDEFFAEDSDGAGANDEEKGEKDGSPGGKKIDNDGGIHAFIPVMDKDDLFHEEIEPLLDKLFHLCQKNDIPVFATLISAVSSDMDVSLHSYASLPFHVCEMQAMIVLNQFPHEFSHEVLRLAEQWMKDGRFKPGNAR